jgi:hypothetical protein
MGEDSDGPTVAKLSEFLRSSQSNLLVLKEVQKYRSRKPDVEVNFLNDFGVGAKSVYAGNDKYFIYLKIYKYSVINVILSE